MCGRYIAPGDADVERLWRIDRRSSVRFIPRYNVAPTTIVPVIRIAADGASELLAARWGLIPAWWKQPKLPALTFNARSEEAAGKPIWREPLRKSRCLMPAAGWYEWQEKDWDTGVPLDPKQPWAILRAAPGAFAGLLSSWVSPSGAEVLSCALLSKAAAPSLARIHDRMPVMLPQAHFGAWLDPAMRDPARVAEMVAAAETDFSAHPVSRAVNRAANEGPELLAPL